MKRVVSMRAIGLIGLIVGTLATTAVNAQNKAPAPSRPPGEQGPDDRSALPLTPAQVAKVKAVLAAYKPATLKADDAKAIKRALRDAGLRHTAALDKAITDAGFSPQRLEELDPRASARSTRRRPATSAPTPACGRRRAPQAVNACAV